MKIHHLKGYIQSIYLVEYPDKLLLLDGCCRADIPTLKQYIVDELRRPLTDLKLIVVTHMHADHAGAAHKLRKLTGCKIASANLPKQWYAGLGGRVMHLVDMMLALWVANRIAKPLKNLWYSPHLTVDHALVDNDILPGFGDWCVLETRGHTDRDLSVLHLPSKRLYVADLLVNVKGRFIVDIDFKGGPKNSAEILEDVLEEEGFSSGQLVTIFARRHHFKMLQSLCPQYALRPHYISIKKTGFLAASNLPLEIMGLRRRSFSEKAAKSITESNLYLFCNVMGRFDNETGYADAIKAGARFIQTDHLDQLIPYLEERNLLETNVLGRDYRPRVSPRGKSTTNFVPEAVLST
mgnify:CR=1 FL=1